MSEVVEHPPQSGGDPAADVVVDHHVIPVTDPGNLESIAEVGWVRQRVSPRALGGRQVGVEVEEDGAGDVARLVADPAGTRRAHDPADVDDAELGRIEAPVQVLRGDDRRIGHVRSSMTGPLRPPCYPVARRLPRRPRRSRYGLARTRRPSLRRSSVVERAAVNRLVVGSSPTAGAILLLRPG